MKTIHTIAYMQHIERDREREGYTDGGSGGPAHGYSLLNLKPNGQQTIFIKWNTKTQTSTHTHTQNVTSRTHTAHSATNIATTNYLPLCLIEILVAIVKVFFDFYVTLLLCCVFAFVCHICASLKLNNNKQMANSSRSIGSSDSSSKPKSDRSIQHFAGAHTVTVIHRLYLSISQSHRTFSPYYIYIIYTTYVFTVHLLQQ